VRFQVRFARRNTLQRPNFLVVVGLHSGFEIQQVPSVGPAPISTPISHPGLSMISSRRALALASLVQLHVLDRFSEAEDSDFDSPSALV
jgi:hypothetical protein